MKTSRFSILLLAIAGGVGCHHDICDVAPCGPLGGGGNGGNGGDGAGGNVGGNGSGGGPDGGGGGGIAPGCELVEGQAVADDCGVFVKAGANGSGTKEDPRGTIDTALNNLGGKTAVYVCGGDTFSKSITLPNGVSLFGGLDCTGWVFLGTNGHPVIEGDANVPAITILEGDETSHIDSVDVMAAPGSAPGAASVGVFGVSTTAEIKRSRIEARDGALGANGALIGMMNPAPPGTKGDDGCTSTVVAAHLGGPPGSNSCGAPVTGGSGGNGRNQPTGVSGTAGEPLGEGGALGAGQGLAGICTGAEGPAGDAGPAGVVAGDVLLLDEGGLHAPVAPDASPGTYGAGGGGGGGARQCQNAANAGPGGGGGGAGGCGGAGGHGGGAGGASVAVSAFESTITFLDVALVRRSPSP